MLPESNVQILFLRYPPTPVSCRPPSQQFYWLGGANVVSTRHTRSSGTSDPPNRRPGGVET